MSDTPPETAEIARDSFIVLSGAERFLMGTRMFKTARRMAWAPVPAEKRNRLLSEEDALGRPVKSREFRKKVEVCAKA